MRIRYIALSVVVLAWIVAALVTGSPTFGVFKSSKAKSSVAGASPLCLPTTLEHQARLAGTSVDVSPEPGTDTANPHTQISFLGIAPANIREVVVIGSSSGKHRGHLAAYSQGDGASYVPDKPFRLGERVIVMLTLVARTRHLAFQFHIDTPYATAGTSEFPNPQAAPADYQSFYTLPGVEAPLMTVTVPDHDPATGDILTTNGPGPGQYGPLIYSPQGQLVWFDKLPAGETAENLSEQTYESQRVLTWWKGRVLSLGFGQGEDLIMSSHYQTVARVPGGNGLHADLHDFQLAPHDVAYITAFNPVRCDLTAVKGSRGGAIIDTAIQEIDLHTGLVRWEWHSLDHVGASESEVEAPSGPEPWDYFHLNSIDPEPDGNLLISARSTWATYQLEAGSGKILWRLGGNKSSFAMGPGTQTAWQHDARLLPGGAITIFDDGSNPPIHHQSRGLRIALDLTTHKARLLSSYTHPDPPLLAASQGNMQTLADGNAVIGYGAVPTISEYSPSGSLLFDAHQPLDMSFYRAFRFPWSAQPQSPPAILADLNNTGEETIVHASWNGATDVSSWRVLAGKTPATLTAQATVPVAGFESTTTLPTKYGYAEVQALDSSGHTLASSRAVAVISYAASFPSSGGAG